MKCGLRHARELSTASGYARHTSISLRSTQRSNNERSKEHSVSRISRRDVAISEIDQNYFSGERKASLPHLVTRPSYIESIARPDSAVNPFASEIGTRGRMSTESDGTDISLRGKEKGMKSRRSVDDSWTLNRSYASDESIPGRPKSTPVYPTGYKEAYDAV
jgi:hypothetical protein